MKTLLFNLLLISIHGLGQPVTTYTLEAIKADSAKAKRNWNQLLTNSDTCNTVIKETKGSIKFVTTDKDQAVLVMVHFDDKIKYVNIAYKPGGKLYTIYLPKEYGDKLVEYLKTLNPTP